MNRYEDEHRYFDETLRQWVTVLPTGRAKGAHSVNTMKPMKASGWRAGKDAARAKHPNLNAPKPNRVRPATEAEVPYRAPKPRDKDRSLHARLLRADAFIRRQTVVTAFEIGTAAVSAEPHPLGKHTRHEIGKGLANLLMLRGRLHKRPDGRYHVRRD